jgi:hypothetical protein
MATKKKTAKKKAVKQPTVKSTDGLSEAEHGQAWERDEVVELAEDESEVDGEDEHEDE